jgi:hypothetical protein
MTDLTLRDARISGASGLVDIEVADGRAWGGRVALGHVTSLAGRPAAERKDVLARLATAEVAVVSLPATDLHLSGRSDEQNVPRGRRPLPRAAGRDGRPRSPRHPRDQRRASRPADRYYVIKSGRVVARTTRTTELRK